VPTALRHTLAALLTFLFVVAFVLLLLSVAIRARLAEPDFYQHALRNADTYDRLYADLLQDPEFDRGEDSLLGGIEFPEGTVLRVVERVVPPERLEGGVDRVIDYIVQFVKDGGTFGLRMDITPFVQRVREVIPEETESAVESAPEVQVSEEDEERLLARVNTAVSDLSNGRIPEAIPVTQIQESARARVSATIVDAANLDASDPDDAQTIDNVDAALANGDLRGAIRAVVAAAIEPHVAEARQTIADSGWVQKEGSGEDETFYLVPAPRVQDELENWLVPVHNIYVASLWIAIGSAVVMVLCAGGIAYLFRRGGKATARWLGTAMIVAGVVAIAGWVIGLHIAREELTSFLAPEESRLADAYLEIVRDVIQQAREDLGRLFWLPGIAFLVTGIVVWVASLPWPAFRGRQSPTAVQRG
jgi:hypothetical protein